MSEKDPLFSSILLVEDDLAHAMLIRRALSRYCPQIEHVKSVGEGREALRQRSSYSLIVSDLNLPDSRSPTTTVQTLREASSDIPILVLTSSQSLRDAIEAMRSGASDFVVKQFDHDFPEIIGLALSKLFTRMEIERERRTLERQMNALRLAIENSSDGLAVVSREGDIRYSNSAFLTLTSDWRIENSQLPSKLEDLLSYRVKGSDVLMTSLRSFLRDMSVSSIWRVGIELANTPAVAFDFSVSVIAEQGDAVAWIRDTSDVKRREKLQRELLSTTTHDLKGPLHAILLSTELIKTREGDEKLVDLVIPRIASSAHNAINLIDEFLSARQIEEGALILVPSDADVTGLVTDTLAEFEPSLHSKGLTVNQSIEDVGNWFLDGTAFRRVLSNLISNAVKFTPRGGSVDITVQMRDEHLRVTVKDSGVGIDPNQANKIFDRYKRLHQGAFSGSGLGLFIVRSLVSAHGGSLEVASRIGEGCAITSIWPRNPPINAAGELISLDLVSE